MKRCRLLSLLLLVLIPAVSASAQVGTNAAQVAEEARLAQLPDVNMRFQDAPLQDVLRTLAEASDMAYIGLPQPKEPTTVDMTIRGNPYEALKLVADTYGFVALYQNGLWHFRPLREEQSKLFPKVYQLKYIHLNEVAVDQKSLNTAVAADSSSVLPSPINSSAFAVDASRVIDDIKALLELDPTQLALTEQEAVAAPRLGLAEMLNANQPGLGEVAKPKPESQIGLKGRIISNPDQNTLFIIASKEHHDWIQTYLTAIDVRRVLVLLETRVVEVRNNPELDIGMDWSAALGTSGYALTLKDATETVTTGTPTTGTTTTATDIANLFATRIDGAILSGPQLVTTLHAIAATSEARTLQHPSQVTVNNRQVVLRNVIQQPFQSGSSSTSGGGASTESNQTQFIPIGTTISLLPRILDEDKVELNIMVNVSQLLGFDLVGAGDNVASVPVTSSRDYSGQAIVASGNTLAIGGLETMSESQADSKVPFFGDIPLFGYLFKRKENSQENTKLLMFITATVLDSYQGGMSSPEEVERILKSLDSQLDARGLDASVPYGIPEGKAGSKANKEEDKDAKRRYLVK